MAQFYPTFKNQCSPKIREQMFVDFEEDFMAALPPENAADTPLVWLHQC